MFDLENALATWRRVYEQHHAFLKGDVDELESHLRDHIERLESTDLSTEAAFHLAQKQMGTTAAQSKPIARCFGARSRHEDQSGRRYGGRSEC